MFDHAVRHEGCDQRRDDTESCRDHDDRCPELLLVPRKTADDFAGRAVNEDRVRLTLIHDRDEPDGEKRELQVLVDQRGRAGICDSL